MSKIGFDDEETRVAEPELWRSRCVGVVGNITCAVETGKPKAEESGRVRASRRVKATLSIFK